MEHPVIQGKPADLGYRMPAEWEPHEATWLVWPSNDETWPGPKLARVQETFLNILEILLASEAVHLLVRSFKEHEEVLKKISARCRVKNLTFHEVPVTDVWIRDFGPTFLTNADCGVWNAELWSSSLRSEPLNLPPKAAPNSALHILHSEIKVVGVKWIFNAWGGKYQALRQDNEIFKNPELIPNVPLFLADFILEGGSIEVNGSGVCLVTEQCLLNLNRNPKMNWHQIEQALSNYLGVSEVVWLGRGLAGDDTDGHIDDLARFINEDSVLVCSEINEQDENAKVLEDNFKRLKKHSKDRHKNWNLIRLPMPGPLFSEEGHRLPASYANFYIANQTVLVPTFDHPHDAWALSLFRELFPSRSIVAIDSRDLILGCGSIHCVTQQQPQKGLTALRDAAPEIFEGVADLDL